MRRKLETGSKERLYTRQTGSSPTSSSNLSTRKASNNLGLNDLYEQNKDAVFLVFSTNGGNEGSQGSGFFVSSSGLGISNQHVFDGYEQHFIKLHDGRTYEVTEILRSSPKSELDYVLFKVNTRQNDVSHLKIANYLPVVGENVFTIGNPKGLEHTLSTGIVSGFRGNNQYIQTTAEITHGSSGGPLFNMDGEVIGITTSGFGEANLNFAVNIKMLELD